jgi:hexosaminidase
MKGFLKKALIIGTIVLSKDMFAQVSIIPKPAEVIIPSTAGSFTLTPQTVLVVEHAGLQATADFLNEYLKQVYGFSLKTSKKSVATNAVYLHASKNNNKGGAYKIEVKDENIAIEGADESGVFYGMQTLLQLLPVQKETTLNIPFIRINDAPRYQYRGMMLDVSRHFFPVDFVKKYIDYLALHKMNYLHWHLTEDQGWRIEIKKYPKLTQAGAWRNGTIIGNYPGAGNDNKKYGGFYTQKEIKDIIQYAAKRYITIVPEIEMPGHASAAIAAFPALSCFPNEPTKIYKNPSLASQQSGGKKVQETWGVHDDVFCAGNDSVFTLLQGVLDEVIALFPSKYIHIGGDECPKANWKKCARCQNRIKEHNLKDEHELQSYFIQRIEKYINSKGRTLVGWDEILEGGLAPNAVVMSWRGEKGGIEAAKQRHDVIMTPNSHLYFDHFQGKPSLEPMAIGGYLTLEKVYSYNPTPEALSPEEAKHVQGVQANLWTEYIATPEKAEYMTMPRLAALSEVAWTQPEQKNWEDFKRRMEYQYQRYDAKGINYAKSAFHVRQTIVLESAASKATVSFATDAHAPQIYYTLDGSEPNTNAKLYTKPFELRKSATIKAASFIEGKQLGKTSEQQVVIN